MGDIRKFKSKAAFGHITGTAPIPASSGAVVRYPLNRAGNRRLNHALHFIALTQARIHPAAKEYVGRKSSEGKWKREAMRCLKRQLANVVYRQMKADAQTAVTQHPISPGETAIGSLTE
ncbi:MAG: transposase [Actinomycetota bacterium]|nr:transposase [Actinomycetota bacterium]